MSRCNRLQASLRHANAQRDARRAAAQRHARLERDTELLRQVLQDVQIALYLVEDGDTSSTARELLVQLGWLLGVGASIAANVEPESPRARRLHDALLTVHCMCLDGYAWRHACAHALDAATVEAHAISMAHVHAGLDCKPEADYLAARIRAGEVTAEDVVGAEVQHG